MEVAIEVTRLKFQMTYSQGIQTESQLVDQSNINSRKENLRC